MKVRLAVALVFASACSRSQPPAAADAAPAAPPSAAPVASAAPETGDDTADAVASMSLLDPGQPPRHKLRYVWRPGQGEILTMDLKTSASTDDGTTKQPEMPLPPVHIVIGIEPRAISPAGDLTYAWRVASTSVQAAPQTPSSVADGLRAEVTAVEHLSGTAVVSSRGLSSKISIDALPALGSATGQMIEQVRQTLRDVAAPFPEEEIGRGARWEKISRLASREARVTQTETFTLADLTGNSGSLGDAMAQTAPPQPLGGPGHPGEARIESMRSSGQGVTTFDLGRLVPQTKFDETTTMVVGRLRENGGTEPDDANRMTMTMRVGIVLAGSLR